MPSGDSSMAVKEGSNAVAKEGNNAAAKEGSNAVVKEAKSRAKNPTTQIPICHLAKFLMMQTTITS